MIELKWAFQELSSKLLRPSQIFFTFIAGALLLFPSGFVLPASAQVDTAKMGNDDLFSLAREKAFNKQYTDARILLRLALQRSPDYDDARILLARTYSWDGNYDSARVELRIVLDQNPAYRDAHAALIDAELWSGQFEQAHKTAAQALHSYPSDEEFLLKKARALKNLNRDEEALNILDKLEDIHPSAPGIASMRQEISTKTMINSVGLNYALDAFTERAPMQYTYLQYGRRTAYGSFFARLNYSYRFEKNGTQLEFDFYPRIADGTYAYVNYGFSNSPLFPSHRFGAECYTSLPASFEGSLGLRYLYFGSGNSVTIYTGTLGYYYRSYWFSFRPYITPGDAGTSKSANLTVRYFYGEVDDYLSLRMGAGFTPDERSLQSSTGYAGTEVFYLNSQTLGIGIQKALGLQYLLTATCDYTNQEKSYEPGSYLKMYSFSAGVRVKF